MVTPIKGSSQCKNWATGERCVPWEVEHNVVNFNYALTGIFGHFHDPGGLCTGGLMGEKPAIIEFWSQSQHAKDHKTNAGIMMLH